MTNKKYRTPDGYTADIAVFTIVTEDSKPFTPPIMSLNIMLIKRAEFTLEGSKNVEAGKWALPGGFVQPDEDAYEAASRELTEETGIEGIHIKQFGVYDKPGRDPRGWIISNAHYAIVPEHHLLKRKASDDADQVELFNVDDVLQYELAFDHKTIIEDAVAVIKKEILQTTAAKNFLPAEFTYSELQAVLSTVTTDPAILNEQSFARKIKALPFIELVEGKTTQRTSKKATKLYKFNELEVVKPIYTARYN
ncbi:8-oxo-dGTP diphosphatase [Cytobacillus horneckiae]|uniref:NUDIX hydrolase n=1 Tax=Cytobacillus horneckiae TaxID=549687 RepID=UPI0019D173E2|nr:NUDIX hydrolase [Cytobacillus horneckiae]MBN6886891.1 NUDIX hydrolase [Cytobacillus horneckiae]MCM3177640.1 NUDIX hydrolase [Cytobacillus horneckiae]MEC1157945.1 NUDIX hydrolase [Cytobacillus horneckiae]MED2937130.1 NUDIX hydrolase [Cytobacillus horneckiae]